MPEQTIRVFGTQWCGDCWRAKRFLDKRQITYQWIDIEKDADARAFVRRVNNGMHSVPTIVFPDGTMLVEPSDADLAATFERLDGPA